MTTCDYCNKPIHGIIFHPQGEYTHRTYNACFSCCPLYAKLGVVQERNAQQRALRVVKKRKLPTTQTYLSDYTRKHKNEIN